MLRIVPPGRCVPRIEVLADLPSKFTEGVVLSGSAARQVADSWRATIVPNSRRVFPGQNERFYRLGELNCTMSNNRVYGSVREGVNL